MEKQKKLNVLDKTKMDWSEVKKSDASMEEDPEKHKKGKTYLEEQDFLETRGAEGVRDRARREARRDAEQRKTVSL